MSPQNNKNNKNNKLNYYSNSLENIDNIDERMYKLVVILLQNTLFGEQ